ncbi:MAG TPA: hypothetical protein VF173_12185 [Thermoanaerobaculia bacterium]|nr:hypothetical protein [Thermoanaerobaculia bacterium]
MKKKNLRLHLNRETLHALTSTDLADVEGAATTVPCSVRTCFTDCHQFSCRGTC